MIHKWKKGKNFVEIKFHEEIYRNTDVITDSAL